jgi:hypothetical protein
VSKGSTNQRLEGGNHVNSASNDAASNQVNKHQNEHIERHRKEAEKEKKAGLEDGIVGHQVNKLDEVHDVRTGVSVARCRWV